MNLLPDTDIGTMPLPAFEQGPFSGGMPIRRASLENPGQSLVMVLEYAATLTVFPKLDVSSVLVSIRSRMVLGARPNAGIFTAPNNQPLFTVLTAMPSINSTMDMDAFLRLSFFSIDLDISYAVDQSIGRYQ